MARTSAVPARQLLLSQQARRWHLALRTDADTAATMLLAMLYGLAVEHAADPASVDEEVMTDAITATLNRVWL
ncbi:MAG: hypothetical protein ABI251_00340 [Mycobacteriaceae bacterium]